MLRRHFGILVVLAAVMALLVWNATRDQQLTAKQLAELVRNDPLAGLEAAEQLLAGDSGDPAVLQLAVDASRKVNLPERGLAILARHELEPRTRQRLLNEIYATCQKLGRLDQLEATLHMVLTDDLNNESARRELTTLLLSECRRFESLPHLFSLVKQRSFLLDELVMLGSWEEMLDDPQLLNSAATDTTNQLIATVARARIKAYSGDHAEALELLSAVKPQLTSTGVTAEWTAASGRSLVAIGNVPRLVDWAVAAESQRGQHPDIEYSLGWLASQQGRQQDAVDDLSGAIELHPDHRQALQLLGTLLAADGQPEHATILLQRARRLDDAERLLHRILQNDQSVNQLVNAADVMEQLGRTTEAWAWLTAAQGLHPTASANLQARTDELLQRSLAESAQSDRATRELLMTVCGNVRVETSGTGESRAVDADVRSDSTGTLRFADISQSLNLTEPYFGGLPDDCRGLTIFQGFGGGVAVLDADADLAPDLYFVNGNTWPVSDDPRSCDRLCRQTRGRCTDISSLAVPADRDFGQGVAVGDFNNDGFDDLYVAAIGNNRLLLNNGDGTFSLDVDTTPVIQSLHDWTTSCAIVDLTGDQIPDLLDINYANGPDVFTKVCLSGPQQLPRSCRPDLFGGAPDRLLAGTPSGGLNLVDEAHGFPVDVGRGMGVIVADFEERGLLDVFVSNDMTPNGLLKAARDTDGRPFFADEALLRGAATNGAGRIQAGMGIAAADLTGDGRMDFFVTNFLEETNTLYSMTEGGFYSDISARSGADEGSLEMLTFGTQAVDADLDGDADLVLVNGHVDDFTHMDSPWKMPPASYENTGAGTFRRLPAESLGAYGSARQLGRAMARLDWNRDGRDDLVVTHLDRNPALLLNESTPVGTSLRLRLRGTESCRTPFGAVVSAELKAADGAVRKSVRHLTAGDGYYCANEHEISLAVKPDEVVQTLTIKWPAGRQQQLNDVSTIGCFVIVESCDRLFPVSELP